MAVNVFPPLWRATNADGAIPATIEFYDAGTTTPKTVYSDKDLTQSLGSVVYTDSAGAPVATEGSTQRVLVYVGTEPYKVVIKDEDAVTLATYDHIEGASAGGDGGDSGDFITEEAADFRYQRNASALTEDTSIADTDIFSRWSTADSVNRAITWAGLKAELKAEGYAFSAGDKLVSGGPVPIGWTRDASQNDKGLRVVSGTAGGTGGSSSWTTIMDSARSISGTVGSTTLTESQLASHDHVIPVRFYGPVTGGSGALDVLVHPSSGSFSGTVNEATDNAGSDVSHTHALSINSFNLGLAFYDVNIITRDA